MATDKDQIGEGRARVQFTIINAIWLLPHNTTGKFGPLPGLNFITYTWGFIWLCFDIRVMWLTEFEEGGGRG